MTAALRSWLAAWPMLSRRKFIGSAAALAVGSGLTKSYGQSVTEEVRDIAFTNGRIHTMDSNNRVVSQLLIRNGRIAAVGDALPASPANVRVVNLRGKPSFPELSMRTITLSLLAIVPDGARRLNTCSLSRTPLQH